MRRSSQVFICLVLIAVFWASVGATPCVALPTTDAFSANSDNPKLQLALSEAIKAENSKDYKTALAQFENAVNISPNDWRGHFHKALCLSRMNETTDAHSEVLQSIKLSPASPEPLLLLATVQTTLKLNELAAKTLKKFIQRFPNDRRSFYAKVLLAENLVKLDSLDEACKIGIDSLSDKHKTPKDMLRLAELIRCTGHLDVSATVLKQFCKAYPNDPRVPNGLAKAKRDEKEWLTEKNPVPSAFNKSWALRLSKQLPIKVCIFAEPGLDPDLVDTSRQCFDEWERLPNPVIQFAFVNDTESADIVFQWTSDPSMTREKNVDLSAASAETSARKRRDGNYQKWIISCSTPKKSAKEYRIRSLHEIGHALGLSHSLEPNDVMCAFRSLHGLPDNLSSNDIQRVNNLFADSVRR